MTNDYVASFIGRARFFLEANKQIPRTFGGNQVADARVDVVAEPPPWLRLGM